MRIAGTAGSSNDAVCHVSTPASSATFCARDSAPTVSWTEVSPDVFCGVSVTGAL